MIGRTRNQMMVNSPDFISFSELPLLRSVTSLDGRPSLLVVCTGATVEAVVDQLRPLCTPPCHICRIPGPLNLPGSTRKGTFLVHDVAELTMAQQIALAEWIEHRQGKVQVVSVTQAPLLSLVHDGRFLEGLFYRLNTVTVLATRGDDH